MLHFHSLLYTANRQITVKGVSWPHANARKWPSELNLNCTSCLGWDCRARRIVIIMCTVRKISSSCWLGGAGHKNCNSDQQRMGCGWLRSFIFNEEHINYITCSWVSDKSIVLLHWLLKSPETWAPSLLFSLESILCTVLFVTTDFTFAA